jgi:hypothetical protein
MRLGESDGMRIAGECRLFAGERRNRPLAGGRQLALRARPLSNWNAPDFALGWPDNQKGHSS